MMPHYTYLTLDDFQVICQELQHFFTTNKEPHPNFSESYFDKLDSVIASPRRTFGKKDLYPDFYSKAACYFYFVNKLHPFANGNKRISIVATGVFLIYNGYSFSASQDDMYEFAKRISMSTKAQKEEFGEVVTFIKNHSRPQREFIGTRILTDLLKLLQKQFRR